MRKLCMCLLAAVMFPLINFSSSLGLSVVYCEEDTVECEVQNCHTDNLVIDWENEYAPDKPLKNCDEYEKKLNSDKNDYILAGAGALAGITAILTLFTIPKLANKYRPKSQKKTK